MRQNKVSRSENKQIKIKKVKHHDLDFLIGTWSPKEAKKFDKSVKIFEKIDDELWK